MSLFGLTPRPRSLVTPVAIWYHPALLLPTRQRFLVLCITLCSGLPGNERGSSCLFLGGARHGKRRDAGMQEQPNLHFGSLLGTIAVCGEPTTVVAAEAQCPVSGRQRHPIQRRL